MNVCLAMYLTSLVWWFLDWTSILTGTWTTDGQHTFLYIDI